MSTLTEFLKGIADALRTKKGTSDPIPAPNFAQEILGIQTGTDTSDATAKAADILSGKTAYGASGKITGSIPGVSGQTITPGTTSKTAIQAGRYASGDISVLGDPNLIAENIKSGVSIFGTAGTLKGQQTALFTAVVSPDNSYICLLDRGEFKRYTKDNSGFAYVSVPSIVCAEGPLNSEFYVSGDISVQETYILNGKKKALVLYLVTGKATLHIRNP